MELSYGEAYKMTRVEARRRLVETYTVARFDGHQTPGYDWPIERQPRIPRRPP